MHAARDSIKTRTKTRHAKLAPLVITRIKHNKPIAKYVQKDTTLSTIIKLHAKVVLRVGFKIGLPKLHAKNATLGNFQAILLVVVAPTVQLVNSQKVQTLIALANCVPKDTTKTKLEARRASSVHLDISTPIVVKLTAFIVRMDGFSRAQVKLIAQVAMTENMNLVR